MVLFCFFLAGRNVKTIASFCVRHQRSTGSADLEAVSARPSNSIFTTDRLMMSRKLIRMEACHKSLSITYGERLARWTLIGAISSHCEPVKEKSILKVSLLPFDTQKGMARRCNLGPSNLRRPLIQRASTNKKSHHSAISRGAVGRLCDNQVFHCTKHRNELYCRWFSSAHLRVKGGGQGGKVAAWLLLSVAAVNRMDNAGGETEVGLREQSINRARAKRPNKNYVSDRYTHTLTYTHVLELGLGHGGRSRTTSRKSKSRVGFFCLSFF